MGVSDSSEFISLALGDEWLLLSPMPINVMREREGERERESERDRNRDIL